MLRLSPEVKETSNKHFSFVYWTKEEMVSYWNSLRDNKENKDTYQEVGLAVMRELQRRMNPESL